MSKSTVNRGTLLKMVREGRMEAKTAYSYDGRNITSRDTEGNDWKPARIMGDPVVDEVAIAQSPTHSAWPKNDWKEGYYNFHIAAFRNKTGRAWYDETTQEFELTYADDTYLLRLIAVPKGGQVKEWGMMLARLILDFKITDEDLIRRFCHDDGPSVEDMKRWIKAVRQHPEMYQGRY